MLTVLDQGWDFAIMHPTCTYHANSGVRWLMPGGVRDEARWEKVKEHAEFFGRLWDGCIEAGIPQFVFENPIMHSYSKHLIFGDNSAPDQIVQPWWFGDKAFKATCHWRYGDVPDLVPTAKLVPPKPGTPEHKAWAWVHNAPPGVNRWKDRSRAFPGLAEAEATQWGGLL